MASTNIRSVSVGSVLIQSGNGVPTHISTKGSIYVDMDTAIQYINKNGISTWAEEIDSNYAFLLTQNQYDAINDANTPSSSNVFATIADLTAGSGDTKEVKASSSDTTAGFLNQKITGSTNITVTIVNNGGNEKILLQQTGLATLSGASFLGAVTAPSFSASSITGDYFYGNGSNLTGISTQDTKVTGGTYSDVTGIATFTNNTGGTFTVTGFNTGTTLGTYFTGASYSNNVITFTTNSGTTSNITINTMTGLTINGGLSATSISADTIHVNQYLDFATGSTATTVTPVAGRVYFDPNENALSYFPNTPNMDVTLNIGEENLIRVYNNTGVQINNGQVCHINGSTDGAPTVTLATGNIVYDDSEVSGVATHDIANGSYGFITNFGIVRDLMITGTTAGSTVYLSDKVVGGFEYDTNNIALSSRINKIGRVINTGTTTGKILVSIRNENTSLSLTDREINILNGNVSSTGVYQFSGITTASTNTFNVAPARGWIVHNTYDTALAPDTTLVNYTGETGLTVTNIASADETYILLTTGNTIFQQTSYPTAQQRRENILLGKIAHPDHSTIISINNNVDYSVSPMSALRDMFVSIKLINDSVTCYPNGANLNFNINSGNLYGMGINWVNNELNPNEVTISAKTIADFNYRTQTGGTSTYVTLIDPNNYDLNGVITAIPTGGDGNANRSTNQRIYLYPSGNINIQYGQQVYETLALALAAQQTETFVKAPNVKTTGILIGLLAVRRASTVLNSTTYAVFTPASIFGESVGGVNGISTTSLQQAYNNSTTPEIIINSILDGLSIQNGTGNADNITTLIEGKNTAGTTTSFIRADGSTSATTASAQTVYITATPTNNDALTQVLVRNTDGSVNYRNASTIGGSGTFTGGTVTGPTIFTNGLTANTISGGTYFGLPTDIYTTGGTYSNGTAIFTNNTGGTFNVTGLYTGGTLTSTGATINITSTPTGFNIDLGIGAALREKNVLVTTGNTQTLLGVISGFTSGTYIVESYITASKSLTEYGVWKRILGVVTTGGTPTIVYESNVLDKVSSGFTGGAIVYSGISDNTIDILVTGVNANTYSWTSYFEVIDEGFTIPMPANLKYVITSTNYTLTTSGFTVEATSACTITLPTAVGSLGTPYRVINASLGNVIVNTTSSQEIGNKPSGNPITFTLQPEEWLDVVSNNTKWRII